MKVKAFVRLLRGGLLLLGCGLLAGALLAFTVLPAWSAGPGNIVTNGEFTANTDHWTLDTGTTFDAVSCPDGAGIGYLQNTAGMNTNVRQCINITTLPSGNWTLSGDGRIVTGTEADVYASFYSAANCVNYAGVSSYIFFDPGAMNHQSATISEAAALSALSVRVSFSSSDQEAGATSTAGCFDNISLSGTNATVVELQDLQARPQPLFAGWLLPGLLALAGGALCLALRFGLKKWVR